MNLPELEQTAALFRERAKNKLGRALFPTMSENTRSPLADELIDDIIAAALLEFSLVLKKTQEQARKARETAG